MTSGRRLLVRIRSTLIGRSRECSFARQAVTAQTTGKTPPWTVAVAQAPKASLGPF
jgi:hypothetical protein